MFQTTKSYFKRRGILLATRTNKPEAPAMLLFDGHAEIEETSEAEINESK
jgi:hypothetical protein